MDPKRAARWAGLYLLYLSVTTVVGGGLALGGAAMAYSVYESKQWMAWTPFLTAVAPYALLAILGVVLYRFGAALALYATLTGAVEEALSETYDTEQVKSDILAVVDERLADIQSDIRDIDDDGSVGLD
ncbi:MAG: hypothetical protein ABEJ85_05145 [Haloarculaceae archaeon]